jgi:hypothetical protein
MKLAELVGRQVKNSFTIFIGKPQKKIPIRRPSHRRMGIKTNVKEEEEMWI